MKIRLATLEDAPAIAHVIVDTFLSSNRGIMSEAALQKRKEEWTYEVSAHNWRTMMREMAEGVSAFSCLYVAETDAGEVVGLSLGCPSKNEGDPRDMGEVDILYVSESHQRHGFGRALVQATAAHLARLGMTRLRICTPVANAQGRSFYEKLGGQVIGIQNDIDEGEVIPLVIYFWADIQSVVNMSK
jgi:ribosomal protein S18 acetylase RimI-like enzyme